MLSLLGCVLLYWGAVMLATDYDIESPFCFFGGLLLIAVGFYLFGASLDMPRTGRAFG